MTEENVIKIPIDMSGTPLPEPEGCKHNERTLAECSITYLDDLHRYVLEVRAHCETCGRRFRFEKLPVAISVTQPCVDVHGYTVSLPIVPGEHREITDGLLASLRDDS